MTNLKRYWNVLFLTSILILIGLLSFPSIAVAKRLNQLESLIKQRKWNEVSKIARPGRDAALYHQVYRIRSFLDSRDNCIEHPQNLTCYKVTMTYWKLLVEDPTNKKIRWSKEFVSYLNAQKDTFIAKIEQIEKERIKEQEEARIKREREEEERIKEQEEARIKREREEEERITRQEEARIKREKEIKEKKREEEKAFNIVSNKAAKLGYKKVLKLGIARFLYMVKKEGGLKEGLNILLWSRPKSIDASLDKKFTISQVLEDFLIYHLSEFAGDELVQFTIMVPKKRGELYLEGQALLGEYFTYTGNLTYQTVLGANKTVPVFKIVEIDDAP